MKTAGMVLLSAVFLLTAIQCKKDEAPKQDDPGKKPTFTRSNVGKREAKRLKQEKMAARKAIMALIRAGNCPGALPGIEAYIKRYPAEHHPYNLKGYCHEQVGEESQALKWFKQALKRKPTSAIYLSNVAKACYRMGDIDCSLKHLRGLSKHSASRFNAIIGLITSPRLPLIEPTGKGKGLELLKKAAALYKTGRWKQAIPHLKKALAEDPDHIPTLHFLAVFHTLDGEWKSAAQHLVRAWNKQIKDPKSDSKQRVQFFMVRGIMQQRRGQSKKAVIDYSEALKLDPRHSPALYGLGAALHLSGKRDAALDAYKRLKLIDAKRAKRLFAILMFKS